MDARDEIMDIMGEEIRIEKEIAEITEAQIKPRKAILHELKLRRIDAYMERTQMRLPLNHGADIVE